VVGTFDTDPLYKHYNIELGSTFINVHNMPEDIYELDEINQYSSDIECLLAQQHTLLWNEDKHLEISPGPDKNLLALHTMSIPKSYRFRAFVLGASQNL
jgi:hypothetical protein